MVVQTVILLIACIKLFSKSYIQEKGKNLATKEDIGGITTIVENIKAEISENNEILKSNLSLKSEHKLNVRAGERDALFSYFKSVKKLTSMLVRFDFTYYTENDHEELRNIDRTFEQYFLDREGDYGMVLLYYPSKKIVELNQEMSLAFNDMLYLLVQAKIDIVLEYELYNIKNKVPSKEGLQAYATMREKVRDRLKKYNEEKLVLYSKILESTNNLIVEIRIRLNQLGEI